jgi:hypothetical protein
MSFWTGLAGAVTVTVAAGAGSSGCFSAGGPLLLLA